MPLVINGAVYEIANPFEGDWTDKAIAFQFGAYGGINVVAFGGWEDALEAAAEWLETHAPGMFEEPDYPAAREELGLPPGTDTEEVWEAAEADLIYTESGYLPSWEVHGSELWGDALEAAKEAAAAIVEEEQEAIRRNPPGTPDDGKWRRIAKGPGYEGAGYQLTTADQYARIIAYKPRSKTLGQAARTVAGIYEKQKGQKVPKGTKWLAYVGWRGQPMIKVIGAHKTLKAAKAAGDKAIGVKRKRARARKNPPSSEFRAMLKTSSRSKASRVKLPKSAKAHKVNGKFVHRSVSNAGGRLRLIQGWTVSMPSGVGLARFKTKAAAERHARSL